MSKKDNMVIVPKYRFPEFRDKWEIKPFKKYIKLYRGSSPRPIQDFITKNEGINWIKISDASNSNNFYITNVAEQITEEGAKKSRLVEEGELILANSMSFGATYEVGVSGCIYDGWFVLREYEDSFIKKFLLQQLNTYEQQKQYSRLSAGGVVKNISSDIVYETILKRPSKKEQQKIADCLSSVDELISAEEKKLSLLNDYKKGFMQKLFPAEGKTVPEWRFPECKDSVEWEENIMDDIVICNNSTISLNKLELKQSGYPVYGADGVVGHIDNFQQSEKYISVVKDGSGVGRLNLNTSHSSVLGTLSCLKSKNKTKYLLEWIYYYLNSIDFSVYVKGSGIPHIYYSDYKNRIVSVPNLPEQQKIADFLSGIDELISGQKDKIEKLKQHKKALMQGLFPATEEVW